ncbi:tetratricopeptide repeat protein [Hydrogenobacter sp. T-2]|uniref:tetratricopeptide repeat protein n=1 Tax=Pampinifervens diazotrophicum TaxID=1632018 RepID=UPI002B257E1C|nr:tetratricopeptide repeat protein [Hydrogenobacter sp. T-2]WPM32012.1 tetratricopeptide repeat protein [Hydrogenobacter sp. T-2]
MKKLLFALLFVWSSAFAINEELCRSLVNAGDYSRAVQVGQELIRRNPNSYWAHLCLTRAYYEVGDFQKSLEHAQALERLARNDEELSTAYNRLGLVYSRLGDLDTALMYHMRHLSLSRKMGDRRGEAIALNNIALIYENKGDYQKALEYYMRSLNLKDDPREKAPTLNNIGIVYDKLGDYKNAERYLKQAIELAEKSGDFHGAGRRMLNLGNIYRKMKNYKLAEELLSEGLERVKRVGDSYWEFVGYNYFTYLYFDMRDYKKSLEYAYMAYELGKRMGYNNSNAIEYISAILLIRPELRAYIEEISKGDSELLKAVEEAKSWDGVKRLVAEAKDSQKQEETPQQQEQAPKKGSQKRK